MRTRILMLGAIALTAAIMTGRAADAVDAKTNYNKYCRICHGEDGKAQTGMGKTLKIRDFTDPKVQESFTDEKITKTIKDGVKKDDRVVMKSFSDKLSDDEIKALVKYVRDFKGKS
jgi:cytochrome c553